MLHLYFSFTLQTYGIHTMARYRIIPKFRSQAWAYLNKILMYYFPLEAFIIIILSSSHRGVMAYVVHCPHGDGELTICITIAVIITCYTTIITIVTGCMIIMYKYHFNYSSIFHFF